MSIKWVVLIGVAAYVLGTVTGVIASKDACDKVNADIDAIMKMDMANKQN